MNSASLPRRALSFDSNPPYSLPLRFFLSAPLFAALAAGLLLWQGPAALASRWSPYTLALTHLLVLGSISMSMLGALMQMLPVVAGVTLARVEHVGPWLHAGLASGTLLLASAFCWQQSALFISAGLVLVATLLCFIATCSFALWQQTASGAGEVVAAIRQSLAALLLTITLGSMLAAALVWPHKLGWAIAALTDVHAMWGLLGWIGLLVMGIAWQVVPMFMVTQPYPLSARSRISTTLFVLLCAAAISSTLAGAGQQVYQLTLALIGLLYGGFAVLTLTLLARRKRPSADTTTLYWRSAMASLLAALLLAILLAAQHHTPALAQLAAEGYGLVPAASELAIGALLLWGVALGVINGMLYKIVPFLTWYHLQDSRQHGSSIPNVNQIIPAGHGRKQFWLHLSALGMLCAACYLPAALSRSAAILMLLASLGLGANLLTALRLFRRLHRSGTLE